MSSIFSCFFKIIEWLSAKRLIIFISIGVLLGVTVAVQWLYPRDIMLPFARLSGEDIGLIKYDAVIEKISTEFELSTVNIETGDISASVQLGRSGASVEADKMVKKLNEYTALERFLPFSLIFKRPTLHGYQLSFNKQKLLETSKTLSSKLSRDPEDAALQISDGKLVVTNSKPGRVIDPEVIKQAFLMGEFGFGKTQLEVPARVASPSVKDEDVELVRVRAEQIIGKQVFITAPSGEVLQLAPEEIAGWLKIKRDESGNLAVETDREEILSYIFSLNDKVGTKPGATKIWLVNGEEVDRTEEPGGLRIASDRLAGDIQDALLGELDVRYLIINMEPVPAINIFGRSYTTSEDGLRAYIDYITKSEDIRISLAQIGGNGWTASGRAGEQLPAASTYKLFIADILSNKIGKGDLSWDTGMLDTNVAGCFERMIVVSDNACPKDLINRFGASNINNYLYDKGFSRATTFTSSVATQSSTDDLLKLLIGIENSTMIGGDDRTRLLSAMERQVYRRGVPAGSAGVVYNKVGFLWEYLHDAAIVRHPKGTYVLAIMTKNSSWDRIAEITRELERIMYP